MNNKNQVIYSGNYTFGNREMLMEKIQMRMSEKRFLHVLRVEEMAVTLAKKYDVSVEKASIAALAHDYAKERPDKEMADIILAQDFDKELLPYGNPIWHGIVGAYLVEKELGIHDLEILQAIRLHTTGAKNMTPLDKVIYVADYVETGRDFPGVETARSLALTDLDQAVGYEAKHTLLHLIESNAKVFPKSLETYNQWAANN